MNRLLLDTLPMPIARAYRQMYDHGPPAEAYHFIALFVEPLLKWYGTLAMTAMRQLAPDQLAKLDIPPRGMSLSLGHWSSALLWMVKQDALMPAAWEPLRVALGELRQKAPPAARECLAAIEEYSATTLQKKSILDFLTGCVLYRNRTRGHGAPTLQHQQQFAPMLLEAYESLLVLLDSFSRLSLLYIERAEIFGSSCVHTLRECHGLFSGLLGERLSLPKADALSAQTIYLFSRDLQPMLELSPILVRPPGRDALYFLNSFANGAEYLSYDGTEEEFHRAETLLDALRDFFGVSAGSSSDRRAPDYRPLAYTEPEDLGFGNLGL